MELTQLLNSVQTIQVTGEVQRKDVAGIQYDSRKIKKNDVFVAISGFKTDGHKFIPEAINQGAIAVVVEKDDLISDQLINHNKVAKILVKDSRRALAELSKGLFDDPSTKLKLVGITGTNGKTTTTYILKHVLQRAGFKTGLMGTIANYIGDTKIYSKLTTPESNDLNMLLMEMIDQKCSYAVMEVSSHSLVLNRVYGLEFAMGIFTNITSDHLDFHKTFDEYLNAKKILFNSLSSNSLALVNADDENSDKMVDSSNARVLTYGISESSDFRIKSIRYDLNGTDFTLTHQGFDYSIHTSLIGTFNAFNATAALAAAHSLGIEKNSIVESIKSASQVPGRFEVIGKGSKKVIVDYSHTADSLEKALQATREIVKNDFEVVTVFGCGGDRDRTKRPEMGKIASELSDKVIITSDNPRTEDSYRIIDEIKKGISRKGYSVIENREEAIKKAIQNSSKNAVILIAGKGHENYQDRKSVV